MNNSNPPLSAATNAQLPTHEEISRRAQELWEKYGRPEGRDEAIWLEAERDLQHHSSAATPAVAPAPTSAAATAAPAAPGTALPARAPQRPSRASATPRMPGGSRGARAAGK